MCLAVPGKVLDCDETSGMREGRVQFAGIVRRVRLDFVPEAEVGDYVMVHVGFAISRLDTAEAERTLALLSEMGALAKNRWASPMGKIGKTGTDGEDSSENS